MLALFPTLLYFKCDCSQQNCNLWQLIQAIKIHVKLDLQGSTSPFTNVMSCQPVAAGGEIYWVQWRLVVELIGWANK